MKIFTAILITWVMCLVVGVANADVIMQDMSGQQWRNSQYQEQEYERRQAQALERMAQQPQPDQLNQSTPMYPNGNISRIPPVIENNDDGYYAAYVAAAIAKKNKPNIELFSYVPTPKPGDLVMDYSNGVKLVVWLSEGFIKDDIGKSIAVTSGVIGADNKGHAEQYAYGCDNHLIVYGHKQKILDEGSPTRVMFDEVCRKYGL